MKKLVFVVIGVIAVIGLLTAFDGDCRGSNDGEHHQMKDKMNKNGGHSGMQDGYQMMCEELELTDTQKEQMEELRINSKKEMIVAESELKLLEIDKRSALKDKNFKLSKKLTGDIFEIKQEMAENRIEQQEQITRQFTDLTTGLYNRVKLEEDIADLESQVEQMDMQLSAPDTHEEALADPDFFSKYESLKKQVQGKMEEWELGLAEPSWC